MLSLAADFFAPNPINPHYGSKVLLVWILVALLVVLWGSRRRATPEASAGGGGLIPPTGRATTTGRRGSHLVLLGFVALYVLLILCGSNFTDHDHDFLTLFSARGEILSPLIWPGEGRFFPLGQQEFNILQLVTRACQGYHLFAVAELLALLALLYVLLDDIPAPWRLGLMAWLLVVPSFLISFTALILPERNVLFAVVVMAFCVQRHARSGSRVALVGALLAAHLALYCKETTLVLLIGFVGARLYLSWRQRRPRTREALVEFCDENPAELGILVLTAVFALLYAIIMLPSASLGYAETHRAHTSLLSLLAAYLRADLLVGVFAVVAPFRLFRAFRRPEEADPLWDPLALGGLGWLAAFLVLGMQGPYYLAPVDLIAVLFLGRLMARQRPRSLGAALLVVVLTLQNFMGSVYHVVERKNIMQAKARMAHVIRDLARARGGEPLQLFFPHASGYHIMGFGAFLSYLGVEIVGSSSVPGASSVLLASPRELAGLCAAHRPQIACIQRVGPDPGGIVVHLPDDAPPSGGAENPGAPGQVLFAYRPFLVPEGAVPFFSLFRRASLTFQSRPLPPTWLTARVVRMEAEVGERPDPAGIR